MARKKKTETVQQIPLELSERVETLPNSSESSTSEIKTQEFVKDGTYGPNEHSLFSPSSGERYIACPPSLLLERQFPNESTEATMQGDSAHALACWKASTLLKDHIFYEELPKPTSRFDDEEMERHTDSYARFVYDTYMGYVEKYGSSVIKLEERVYFDKYVNGGFGTSDCLIANDKVVHIIDFKYGSSHFVSAVNNTQMKIYALASLQYFEGLFDDVELISMTIYQPRMTEINENGEEVPHISTWTMTKDSLMEWAYKVLVPRAALALGGRGNLSEGKHCTFCKAKSICSKKIGSINEVIKKLDEIDTKALAEKGYMPTDEEIVEILKIEPTVSKALSDIKDYAKSQMQNGHVYNGIELVERKGQRYWNKDVRAEDILALFNSTFVSDEVKPLETVYKTELMKVAEIEKLSGDKKKFDEVLGSLISQSVSTLIKTTKTKPE